MTTSIASWKIPRVLSLALSTVSFGAWILYVVVWGILYYNISERSSSTQGQNVFIPFWCFVASGPMVYVTSVLRDAVELCTTNATVRTLGWILVAFYIFFFVIFLLSGIALLIEMAVVVWVLIFTGSALYVGLGVLICCGGIGALVCQCLSSIAAIIGWAMSLCYNKKPHQTATVQPINVMPPMQQPVLMYAIPCQQPPSNKTAMYHIPYGQPMQQYAQPMNSYANSHAQFMEQPLTTSLNDSQNKQLFGQSITSAGVKRYP